MLSPLVPASTNTQVRMEVEAQVNLDTRSSQISIAVVAALATLSAAIPNPFRRTITLPVYTDDEMDAMLADHNMTYPPDWRDDNDWRPPSGYETVPVSAEGPQRRQYWGQTLAGECDPTTSKVGDGNPHQNYYHKQVSETMDCGGRPDCSVTKSTSYTQGWIAGISVTGPKIPLSGGGEGGKGLSSIDVLSWITGGFDVIKTYTTGTSYTCPSDGVDTVCIWWNVAYTAYTVEATAPSWCGVPKVGPYIMWSPNNNDGGGGPYCVRGARYCRAQGQGYWVDSGRAGGPPSTS